jgi:FixJ family two-component response regulator
MNDEQVVYIVDDDEGVREGLGLLMDTVGQAHKTFDSALAFLEAYDPDMDGCLLLDIRMPRMTGLELQDRLNEMGSLLPIIFITGHGDIPMAVDAMRRGALDFIRKPFREQDLLERINEALNLESGLRRQERDMRRLAEKIGCLTDREREVFELVTDGLMNKAIAQDLGISERTVELHRGQVMKKLDARTLAQLVRLKIDIEQGGSVE